jgi:hypothetical protein
VRSFCAEIKALAHLARGSTVFAARRTTALGRRRPLKAPKTTGEVFGAHVATVWGSGFETP